MMSTGPDLVADPDQATPDWLTAALGSGGLAGGASVVDVRRERIGTGLVGQCIRFTLDWDRTDPGLPRAVIGKFPSPDPKSRERGATGGEYEREVRFYQRLAAAAGIRVPRCHYAAYNSVSGDFALLLDDLAPARQGDQLTGCDLPQARAALDQAAALHAAYWADPVLDDLPYLNRSHAAPDLLGAFIADVWPVFREQYHAALPPGGAALGDRFVASCGAWAAMRTGPLCLTHGDFRVDNMMFAGAAVTVVDWQTIHQAAAASDVAYFLGASLPPEVRRAHEDELLRGYHEALRRAGVSDYPWPRFRADYRHAVFAGVVMSIGAAMLVGTDARGEEMFAVMINRHLTHALDTGAADLLP
jgi:hypothetical protein